MLGSGPATASRKTSICRPISCPFAPLENVLTTYAQRDLAKKTESGRWRLTPKGFMVSNAILVELLDVQQKSNPLAKLR